MSKQKRSRALLRNLRKQARKGTLSAREKQQLASQEKKFRKARKSTAKGVGAGLAGAAALLSTTAGQQLMSGVKDFRSARADERSKKEAEKLEELARQREEETGVRMAEGADRAEEAEREEDRQKLIARADEFERQEAQDRERVTRPVTDVDFGMGAEGPSREEFDRLQMDRSMDFSDPMAMGATRASSRDAAADLGRAEFDRAQRILAGELTGDSRVDFGFDIEDQPKEQDFPNEFFPLDQVYESRERSRRERPGFDPDAKGPMEEGGKVEYGIGGAILGGINALRSGQGLGGAALAAGKGFVTPGSGIAQGAKLAGGLLAGSQNPALAKFGQGVGVASNFMPGGGGAMGALGALPGLLSGEQGMKVQQMRQGGRASDLKKMIAKKYGFR
jgi:hypothetical protein